MNQEDLKKQITEMTKAQKEYEKSKQFTDSLLAEAKDLHIPNYAVDMLDELKSEDKNDPK